MARGLASTLFADPERHSLPRNFELDVEGMTRPGSRAAIVIGSPAQKSAIRITIASATSVTDDPRTWVRTGSSESRRHVYKNLVHDNTWFRLKLVVTGERVQVYVDDLLLVDFVERAENGRGEERTMALHWSGGDTEILFRNIRLRETAEGRDEPQAPEFDETDEKIRAFTAMGIPTLDLHAHLKGGLTLDEVLSRSRRHGIQYGIAVNCGKGFPIENDELAVAFCNEMRGQPAFAAMQAEGREWTSMFSRQTAAAFDYIFTDSMTWTDNHGRRMRLWIPDEVGRIANPDDFMETLVARAVNLLEHEPIDIYVNPTYLPDVIVDGYDQLWTDERMVRVIEAAARNDVAIELNELYQLPSAKFMRLAKSAGCKFTLGSNNTSPDDLRRSEYGLKMIEHCELTASDFFVPGTTRAKAITRKPEALRD